MLRRVLLLISRHDERLRACFYIGPRYVAAANDILGGAGCWDKEPEAVRNRPWQRTATGNQTLFKVYLVAVLTTYSLTIR